MLLTKCYERKARIGISAIKYIQISDSNVS
jgi:hypothetical protein